MNIRYRRLVFSLLLVPVVLIGLEVSLRLIRPDSLSYYRNVKLLHVYNPDYRVGLAPDADLYIKHHRGLWEGRFTTNSLGYRGSPEPDLHRRHLACLGDSIVMGFGVSDDETFCSQLNGITLSNESYQAFNLGVDAFGSYGYLKRLEEASDATKLDLVLLFVSPNDFLMPESLRGAGVLPDDEADALRQNTGGSDFWFHVQFEATRVSYALMALKLAVEQLRIKRIETQQGFRDELTRMGLTEAGKSNSFFAYIRSVFYRFPKRECDHSAASQSQTVPAQCPAAKLPRSCKTRETPRESLAPLPEITQRSYQAMIDLSKRKGFALVPVMLPLELETLQCGMAGKYNAQFDYALRMAEFFRKRGVTVLDLRRYMPDLCHETVETKHGRRPPGIFDLIIPGDGHFTARGNRWVSRSLRTELERVYR